MGMISVSDGNGICRVVLDGEVTIYTVGEIKACLALAILEHDETEIDLGAVDEMDAAGLQLMLMAKRCEGKKVRFVNHSASVLRLLDLADLGSKMGDPLLFSSQDSAQH